MENYRKSSHTVYDIKFHVSGEFIDFGLKGATD